MLLLHTQLPLLFENRHVYHADDALFEESISGDE